MLVERAPRGHYLGMSSLGYCQAELWRNFHGKGKKDPVDARTQRIFDLGNVIEDEVIKIVRCMPDVTILSEQAEYQDFDGQLRGHSDLVISTPDYSKIVPDVKSMNNSRFEQFERMGLRASNWGYYVQLMVYAGYELDAEAIMCIAYNKDTSAIGVEIIPFDLEEFVTFRTKAKMILESKDMPPCERGNGRVKFCSCRRG